MKQYSIIKNARWLMQRFRQQTPTLLWQPGVDLLLTLSIVALQSLIPAVLVAVIRTEQPLRQLFLTMILMGLLLGAVYWLQSISSTYFFWKNMGVSVDLLVDDGAGFLALPFEQTLDQTVNAEHQASREFGYGGDDSGAATFWPSLVKVTTNVLVVLAVALVLGRVSWWLPLVTLSSSILAGLLLFKADQRQAKIRESLIRIQAQREYLETSVYEVAAGQDIRLNQLADWYEQKIKNVRREILQQERQLRRQQISAFIGTAALALLRGIFIYGLLVVTVWHHSASVAAFTFYFLLAGSLDTFIVQALLGFNQLLTANARLNIGRKWLDRVTPSLFLSKTAASVSTPAPDDPQPVSIALHAVSYHYPNQAQLILQDINLTINPGEKVALVGRNGAGKTTLILLLLGLLQPTSGEIEVAGQPASKQDLKNYWHYFAPVFQESLVLATTVAGNVALTTDYRSPDVQAALRQAGLAAKIDQLPAGLTTELTQHLADDGILLSGGETQALMLARALYRQAPVQVFDEPTAALDALAEAHLYQEYATLAAGKTSLFISHRLASTQFSDRIIFLVAGRIVAQGTHQELLRTEPAYRQLFTLQGEYYQTEGRDLDES